MQVQTIYSPRGSKGAMFLLLSDGAYFKWNSDNRRNEFVKSSKTEFEKYRDESVNIWWNKYTESWGAWSELEKSTKEAGKNYLAK